MLMRPPRPSPKSGSDAEALVDHRSLARLLSPVKQRPTGSRAKAPGQVRYDRLEPIESFQRRPNNFHLTASKQGVDQPEILQLLGGKQGELVKKLFKASRRLGHNEEARDGFRGVFPAVRYLPRREQTRTGR